jgi:hypothetical protein
MTDHHYTPEKKPGWADNPTFIRVFIGILTVSAIAAGLAGFNPAWHNPHPHFDVERVPVFFAIYGFVAFAFIVLAGQHLRKLVGRKEEYYDERE